MFIKMYFTVLELQLKRLNKCEDLITVICNV